MTQGDIVRLRLARETNAAGTSYHDYLYQVQRITKTLAGNIGYECTHFPVDEQGRSLIALAVASATGSGILLNSNRSGLSCDMNSSTDQTVPPETSQEPDTGVTETGKPGNLPWYVGIPGNGNPDGGYPGGPPSPNPDDGLDPPNYPLHQVVGPVPNPEPKTGAGLVPAEGALCGISGRKDVTWYKNGVKIVTQTFINEGNYVTTYESGQAVPGYLNPVEGIIAIGTGNGGDIYTSVTTCNDGTKHGAETPTQAGIYPRTYTFQIKNPTEWEGGNYISYNIPPYYAEYAGTPAIYVYNESGEEFVAAQGPSITELWVIPQ